MRATVPGWWGLLAGFALAAVLGLGAEVLAQTAPQLPISARSAVLIEAHSGRVLYEKNCPRAAAAGQRD